MHIYVHTYIHICKYTCIHIYIYIYICIYTCVYIVHMHIELQAKLLNYFLGSNKSNIIHSPCSEREANVYADIHNICLTYTPAHAWCSTTPVNACILSAKMRMGSYIYIYIYIYTCTYIDAYVRT